MIFTSTVFYLFCSLHFFLSMTCLTDAKGGEGEEKCIFILEEEDEKKTSGYLSLQPKSA